ncbi:MAG: tetratricopeptide repeat protein [Clostridium sp.]|nr:tetratricopeptide repeat protein [Clostridium sp.]
MRKVVLLITILFVSVISTACINNLAVQELNNKAKEYMANGETEKAICRLRSSIDLDDSIFETHYNLGVALIADKEYEEAQAALENAIKLKPDFADSYYSLAMAFENQADEIVNSVDENKDSDVDKEDVLKTEQKKELSDAEKSKVVEIYNSAIDNYNKYLAKNPEAQDKDKITSQIDYINGQINKYNTDRNTDLSEVSTSPSSEE